MACFPSRKHFLTIPRGANSACSQKLGWPSYVTFQILGEQKGHLKNHLDWLKFTRRNQTCFGRWKKFKFQYPARELAENISHFGWDEMRKLENHRLKSADFWDGIIVTSQEGIPTWWFNGDESHLRKKQQLRCNTNPMLLLMEEILHQLIGSLSHYLQGLIHPRWCRISSINSSNTVGPFFSWGGGTIKAHPWIRRWWEDYLKTRCPGIEFPGAIFWDFYGVIGNSDSAKQCQTGNSARNKSFFQDFGDANYYMKDYLVKETWSSKICHHMLILVTFFQSQVPTETPFSNTKNSKPKTSSTPCRIIKSLSHFCWIMKTL